MTPYAVARARQQARRLLRDQGVESAEHIDLQAIAAHVGASIVHSPAMSMASASARLARVGERAIIRVSEHIKHEGARRFSIAHELGHLVLGHEESMSVLCPELPPQRGADGLATGLEAEANAFASELLMPEALVRRRCEVSPVSLDVPRAIARDFRVSLLAATRRFVELTPERCAFVFTSDGAVRWATRSATFAPIIATGRRIDRDAVAFDVHRGRQHDQAQEVPAAAWLDMSDDGGSEIIEHSTAVPELGAVASLLWIRERDAVALRCYD